MVIIIQVQHDLVKGLIGK